MRNAPVYVLYRWTLSAFVFLTILFTCWKQFFPDWYTQVFSVGAWWLSIHVLTLGVVATSILVWVWHFAVTLLRCADFTASAPLWRLTVHVVGTFILVSAFLFGIPVLFHVGFTLVLSAFVWLFTSLVLAIRKASFQGPLAPIVYYYALAVASFSVGLVSGLFLGIELFPVDASSAGVLFLSKEVKSALLLTHIFGNVICFVGLIIFVTLGTLLPTTSHTKVVKQVRQILLNVFPLAIFGVITLLGGSFLSSWILIFSGYTSLTIVFIILLLVATLPLGVIKFSPLTKSSAHWGFATQTLCFGAGWLIIAVLLGVFSMLPSRFTDSLFSASELRFMLEALFPVATVGVLQILLGSLAYLLPMIIGLGAALRRSHQRLNQWVEFRVFLLNLSFAGSFLFPAVIGQWFWVFALIQFLIALIHLVWVLITQIRNA